jgi:hypothetical protein
LNGSYRKERRKNTSAITGKKLPEYSIQVGWRRMPASSGAVAGVVDLDAVGRQPGVAGVVLGQRASAAAALLGQVEHVQEPDHARDHHQHEQD